MKRILSFFAAFIFLVTLSLPVSATSYSVPKVPDAGEKYMPENTEDFADGLWYILKTALKDFQPEFYKAAGICLSVLAVVILMSILKSLSNRVDSIYVFISVVVIGTLLITPTGTLIALGTQTILEIHEYSKLFIPVITAALAAQGGIHTSSSLYMGTTIFCTLLTTLISKILVPALHIYLCLSLTSVFDRDGLLLKLKGFIKWLLTWSLKTILYVFTGFLTVSGVISGSADASALKAAKLTISGFVPVVGNILSDASEALLVGSSIVKNSAGVYGLFAVLSVWIGPFLKIGIQCILIQFTAAVSSVFGVKETNNLIQDFSSAMGMVLAMTATICVMLLISIICFMKGVA